MSARTLSFDNWIRSSFVEINTELEELYFAQENRGNIPSDGAKLRQQLHDEGRAHIIGLLDKGPTQDGFESTFDLLGNIGLYMSACRRHEITEPSREETSPLIEASSLAMQIGASLGVAPRFIGSHVSTHNFARNGAYRSFTRLEDERLFLDCNTRGIFAYKRAADALLKTVPMGITHPVTGDLLRAARRALEDVAASNDWIFEELDADRFFYSVRPYYKSYRVGATEYRGANAGDFADTNEIDLLLGLCQGHDPWYSQLLIEKMPYMMPEDQARLRDCMQRKSLMDQILESLNSATSSGPCFEENARLFLDVCGAHGKTASQQHNQLMRRFVEDPSASLDQAQLTNEDILIGSRETLKDMRIAALRDDIPSRHRDIARIRDTLGPAPGA